MLILNPVFQMLSFVSVNLLVILKVIPLLNK